MDMVAYVLQGVLALMFVVAGFGKVVGMQMHVDNFNHWRLPQWFRVVTGLIEVIGAAALIVGYWEASWAAAGALLLGIVAVGGLLTHLRAKDSFKQASAILLLGILAFILFYLQYSELANFPGFN